MSLPRDSGAGASAHHAKAERACKERDLELLRTRVARLAKEEERVARRIGETHERRAQVQETKQRNSMMQAVKDTSLSMREDHLAQRRQSLGLQRQEHTRAVSARTRVLLQVHNAGYTVAKQEQANRRAQREQEQQARCDRGHRLTEERRHEMRLVRAHREAREAQQLQQQHEVQRVQQQNREAELGGAAARLSGLTAEEARLVESVARHRRRQQREYDQLSLLASSGHASSAGASRLSRTVELSALS